MPEYDVVACGVWSGDKAAFDTGDVHDQISEALERIGVTVGTTSVSLHRELPEAVVGDTVADTFHRAVCADCRESPDGDGSEYQPTPEEAIVVALDLEYARVDGRLLCANCAAPDDDDPSSTVAHRSHSEGGA